MSNDTATIIINIVDKFGVSFAILCAIVWLIHRAIGSVMPLVAAAIVERLKAGTDLTRETMAVVRKLPEVMATGARETRDAIASFERAMVSSEARMVDAFGKALDTLKGEIFDHKQDKIESKLERLNRKAPDSDAPATETPVSRRVP